LDLLTSTDSEPFNEGRINDGRAATRHFQLEGGKYVDAIEECTAMCKPLGLGFRGDGGVLGR
jgi:hypothetical protein